MPRRDAETGQFVRGQEYTKDELIQHLIECERRYGKVTRKLLNDDDDFADRVPFDRHFGTLTQAKRVAGVAIGQDRLSDDEYAELDPVQFEELFTGLLMGDASIDATSGRSPCLHLRMTNCSFLEWLDNRLGALTTGVRRYCTAAEAAEHARQTGFRPNANAKNYRDVYDLRTRRHPWFDRLAEWYTTGVKTFPSDLTLTPTVTKMWYVCDGGLVMTKAHTSPGYPFIKSKNEMDRSTFLLDLFESIGFSPRFDEYNVNLVFSRGESDSFLEWIDEPPPGFEYKWETDQYDAYKRYKQEAYTNV